MPNSGIRQRDHEYRHILVDTSALVPAICPKSHQSEAVCQRAKMLFEACQGNRWPSVRLATSTLCISEAFNVIDKMRLCEWHGGNKTAHKQISLKDYDTYIARLNELLVRQEFTTIDTGRDVALAAGLVSPINQKYQFRRRSKIANKRKIKPPMGAADCLVIATGIIFATRVSPSDVYLVTADQRMADVLTKARRLTKTNAETLRLIQRARRCGVTWRPELYPKPLNLMTAQNRELREAFSAWPLPTQYAKRRKVSKLSDQEKDQVIYLYLRIAATTKISIDRLPYSAEINQLRANVARFYGFYLSNEELFLGLQSWRKANYVKQFRKERLDEFPRPTILD